MEQPELAVPLALLYITLSEKHLSPKLNWVGLIQVKTIQLREWTDGGNWLSRSLEQNFHKKTKEPLASMLDDAFTFNSPRHGTKDSKKNHLNWCVSDDRPSHIGNWNILHEVDGVMVGTHTATFLDGTLLVMFHGKEVSGKLIEWTINSGQQEGWLRSLQAFSYLYIH